MAARTRQTRAATSEEQNAECGRSILCADKGCPSNRKAAGRFFLPLRASSRGGRKENKCAKRRRMSRSSTWRTCPASPQRGSAANLTRNGKYAQLGRLAHCLSAARRPSFGASVLECPWP
ncbi:hypothetical protein MTO96_021104 [Rhipicephalus appendiculatus]